MLRVLLVEPKPGDMSEASRAIRELDVAEVAGLARDGLEAAQLAVALQPDVAIFPDEVPGMDVFRSCALVTAAQPKVWPIIIASAPDNDFVAQAMLAGARAIVRRGDAEGLSSVLHQLADLRAIEDTEEFQLATDPSKAPFVVAVTSAKGGVGKTTVAINLAVCLAREGHSVALVDSFAQLGDISVALDLSPPGTLADLIARTDDLDVNLLSSYLSDHPSGVKVLAGPAEPLPEPPSLDFWAHLITLLRRRFRFVVLDCPAMPWPSSEYVFSRSDAVLMVTTASDVITVRNAALLFRHLRDRLGLGDRVKLVINQVSRMDGLAPSDVEKACGAPAFAIIPFDAEAVREAANQGRPLVELHPNREVSQAMRRLARELVAERTQPAPAGAPVTA